MGGRSSTPLETPRQTIQKKGVTAQQDPRGNGWREDPLEDRARTTSSLPPRSCPLLGASKSATAGKKPHDGMRKENHHSQVDQIRDSDFRKLETDKIIIIHGGGIELKKSA